MAWCHQATSHYPNQCWQSSMMPYGVTRPQWSYKYNEALSWDYCAKIYWGMVILCFKDWSTKIQYGSLYWHGHDDVIKWTNSPVTGEFPSKRPVTQSFDVFFDLCPKKKTVEKQSRRRWFETSSRPLWRHCNVNLNPSMDEWIPLIKSQ